MSVDRKMHGLDGRDVEPDWPYLTLPEADDVLRRYPDAEGAKQLLTFSPRPFSAASLVATPRGSVFVKRHHISIRTKEDLREEHCLMEYLHGRDALVGQPLRDADGETVTVIADWTYEVHPLANGVDLYENVYSWSPFLSTSQAHHAGRALAGLHHAAIGYHAPARRARTLLTSFSIFSRHDPWAALERYLQERPILDAYLTKENAREEIRRVFSEFHDRLRPYLSMMEPLWTHNDCHGSNLFWNSRRAKAKVTAVIDFGLADLTNAEHDLATAIERNGIGWLEIDQREDLVQFEQIAALLAGYEMQRPLSRHEAEAMVALLPLVHAEFALSETDYYLRILKSEANAEVAYKTYLLGHAEWFRTAAGKLLLERLSHWAEEHEQTPVHHARTVVAEVARKNVAP